MPDHDKGGFLHPGGLGHGGATRIVYLALASSLLAIPLDAAIVLIVVVALMKIGPV